MEIEHAGVPGDLCGCTATSLAVWQLGMKMNRRSIFPLFYLTFGPLARSRFLNLTWKSISYRLLSMAVGILCCLIRELNDAVLLISILRHYADASLFHAALFPHSKYFWWQNRCFIPYMLLYLWHHMLSHCIICSLYYALKRRCTHKKVAIISMVQSLFSWLSLTLSQFSGTLILNYECNNISGQLILSVAYVPLVLNCVVCGTRWWINYACVHWWS